MRKIDEKKVANLYMGFNFPPTLRSRGPLRPGDDWGKAFRRVRFSAAHSELGKKRAGSSIRTTKTRLGSD